MPLGTRGTMDARFPWYGRTPAVGAMLAHVSIRSVGVPLDYTAAWDPYAALPADRQPSTPHTLVEVWRGRGRVQPNVDWRARKHVDPGQMLTEHAVRIQIGMDGNTLPGAEGTMPVIGAGDWLNVLDVLGMQGVPSDDVVTRFTYTIRNIIGSSNSWTKTLLCDIVVDSQTAP